MNKCLFISYSVHSSLDFDHRRWCSPSWMFILRTLIVLFTLSSVNGLTCDKQLCTAEHKSCRIEVNENQVECTIECSTEDGSSNQCTYDGGKIECLCEKDGCVKDNDLLTKWRVEMEDKHGPFVTDHFDKCLAETGLVEGSTLICNGQQCYKGRAMSCIYDMQKGKECTGACSMKMLELKCEMPKTDHMRCYCPISNCHESPNMIDIWKIHADKLIKGFSGIDDCLYTTGTVSRKKCGNKDCFYKNDKSCKLVVPSEAKNCTFECSNEDYVADTCNSRECLCKDGDCYQQEETVTKWRNDPQKPNGLDICLANQSFLAIKSASGVKCHLWLDEFGFESDYTICEDNYCAIQHLYRGEEDNCIIGCVDEMNHNMPYYSDRYDFEGFFLEIVCNSGDFCAEDSQLLNAHSNYIPDEKMQILRNCAARLARRMNMSGPGVELTTTSTSTTPSTTTTTTLPTSTTTETEKKEQNAESKDESSAFKNGFFFVVLVVFKMYANYVI